MARKEHARTTPLPPTSGASNAIIRANVNREIIMSPNFFSVYANDIQIQTSPWDVRLILGQISTAPTSETPTAAITQLGELRLSPQLAKKLTMILIQQLQSYEKHIGEIPVPQD